MASANENEVERHAGIQIPPGTTLEDLERAAVEQALRENQGNRTHAAKSLGISVRTLQRKLKAWHGSNNSGSPPADSRMSANKLRPMNAWAPAAQGMTHPLAARVNVGRL
jgi:hypothetical protein